MANINEKPSKYMYNLLHVLPAYVNEAEKTINAIVEVSAGTINKYEVITESGQLKLDRVGYSSLSYPFTYGAIPKTWDYDGDPLDVEIVNITEPLIPGSLVEVRVIGVMKFVDGGEVDDKIIGVLAADKRSDHITHGDHASGLAFLKSATADLTRLKRACNASVVPRRDFISIQ
jgi:inorganic pyrophosphatase